MKDFTHLTVDNSDYVEKMFSLYRENPDSLSADWKYFFDGVEFVKKFSQGTSDFDKEMKAVKLIEAYRMNGHLKANLDPLGIQKRRTDLFELSRFGFADKELKEVFQAGKLLLGREAQLSEILSVLEATYCGTFAVQFEDVPADIREWVIQEVEQKKKIEIPVAEKKEIFSDLIKSEGYEKFVHTRYVGVKRFSGEGAEAIIPVLNKLLNEGAKLELTDVVLGMAHRGRLNMLVNFFGKSLNMLFASFDGKDYEGAPWFTGDVKYHMGYSQDRKAANGKTIHVAMSFNPSHLETVNPIVEGMVWAKQLEKGKASVLPILVHGDAAFIGQGVVAETLQMSQLQGYSTGGTIHIAIDNHVGFTTDAINARSTTYCSDIMKSIQVPVLHVNGDDIEACVRAADIAVRFRNKFKKDICIRLSCYRKYGHNEGDEPAYTQPLMYEKIKTHPTPREVYQQQLEKEGVLAAGEGAKAFDAEIVRLQKILDETRANPPKLSLGRGKGIWKDFKEVNIEETKVTADTKFSESDLTKLCTDLILAVPTKVEVMPKLKTQIEKKAAKFQESKQVDWATAELLAYGSLIKEGFPVRLAGQDAQRGTFVHRHAVYHDYKTNETFNFLNTINPKAQFYNYDSLLSEYAALGFEYGVTLSNPNMLTIWEAQFGDFVNGAQIIIDQYISAGEQKWQEMSGLMMLLPHGFEGQGPEHSSARLERFLQLCASGNMQVCNVTTPAQFFHMARRQLKRNIRKPLIVMSPKSLLRHPRVISSISELAKGEFHEGLGDDTIKDTKKTKRAILCTGKVYYELLEEREKLNMNDDVALLRAEQIYPFPHADLLADLKRYPNLKEIIWAQEEPENMGALFFVRSKMNRLKVELGKKDLNLGYIARPERSSPACGTPTRHKQEQDDILKKAFNLNG